MRLACYALMGAILAWTGFAFMLVTGLGIMAFLGVAITLTGIGANRWESQAQPAARPTAKLRVVRDEQIEDEIDQVRYRPPAR